MRLLVLCLNILLFFVFSVPLHSFGGSSGQLYQVSTSSALLSRNYDGTVSYGQIKKFGDFGLGTFDGFGWGDGGIGRSVLSGAS